MQGNVGCEAHKKPRDGSLNIVLDDFSDALNAFIKFIGIFFKPFIENKVKLIQDGAPFERC